MSRPPENTRGIAIQIKGSSDDPLIREVEALALKRGIPVATTARILLRDALDRQKVKP